MRRHGKPPVLPEPDRASDVVIARCRAEIEGRGKRVVRRMLLPLLRRRLGLAELGEGFQWPRRGRLAVARGSRIGRFAYLGEGFASNGPIVLGDLCMIAAGCVIVGNDHRYDLAGTPTRLAFETDERPPTIFGADVWLGQRVTILEGLTIGRGAVVATGSVVVRDVPPHAIVAGVPARVIRSRFDDAHGRAHAHAVYARPDGSEGG